MFAEVPVDSDLVKIVKELCGLLTTIIGGVISFQIYKLTKKTENVSTTLNTNAIIRDKKLDTLSTKTDETTKAVQDNSLTLLKTNAEAKRKICTLTHDVKDCEEAVIAEQTYLQALEKYTHENSRSV